METAFGPVWLTITTWVFTALLLFLAIVSSSAARGAIAPNPLVGIRTPKVRSSARAWRAGHAAAAPVAWAGFGVALVCAVVGLAVQQVRFGVVATFAITVVLVFLVATRAAGKRA